MKLSSNSGWQFSEVKSNMLYPPDIFVPRSFPLDRAQETPDPVKFSDRRIFPHKNAFQPRAHGAAHTALN